MSKQFHEMGPNDPVLDSTDVASAVDAARPYGLGAFASGGTLESGEIRSLTLTAQPTGDELAVVLDFGNDATKSADAMLWLDVTALETDVTLDVSGAEGITYTFVGEGEPFTATHGKAVLFSFTRIGATTVLVCKREF